MMPDHRSTAADHRSTMADHGGDRRSLVAVNDGRRWRTTVDRRWTTVDHHRSTVVGRPVSSGQGPGLGRVWIWSGLGRPCGMPRVSHVYTYGIHVDADMDIIQHVGVKPDTFSSSTQWLPQEPAELEHTYTAWPIVVRHEYERTVWPVMLRHAYVKIAWPSVRPE
nr:hypothetical protein [Tanacetum cinerariifolium]